MGYRQYNQCANGGYKYLSEPLTFETSCNLSLQSLNSALIMSNFDPPVVIAILKAATGETGLEAWWDMKVSDESNSNVT